MPKRVEAMQGRIDDDRGAKGAHVGHQECRATHVHVAAKDAANSACGALWRPRTAPHASPITRPVSSTKTAAQAARAKGRGHRRHCHACRRGPGRTAGHAPLSRGDAPPATQRPLGGRRWPPSRLAPGPAAQAAPPPPRARCPSNAPRLGARRPRPQSARRAPSRSGATARRVMSWSTLDPSRPDAPPRPPPLHPQPPRGVRNGSREPSRVITPSTSMGRGQARNPCRAARGPMRRALRTPTSLLRPPHLFIYDAELRYRGKVVCSGLWWPESHNTTAQAAQEVPKMVPGARIDARRDAQTSNRVVLDHHAVRKHRWRAAPAHYLARRLNVPALHRHAAPQRGSTAQSAKCSSRKATISVAGATNGAANHCLRATYRPCQSMRVTTTAFNRAATRWHTLRPGSRGVPHPTQRASKTRRGAPSAESPWRYAARPPMSRPPAGAEKRRQAGASKLPAQDVPRRAPILWWCRSHGHCRRIPMCQSWFLASSSRGRAHRGHDWPEGILNDISDLPLAGPWRVFQIARCMWHRCGQAC